MSKRRFPGIHQLPLVIIKLSSAVRAKTGEGQLHYMALHLEKVHQWKKCISSWTHQSFSSIPLVSFKPPCFIWRAIKHQRINFMCTKVIELTSCRGFHGAHNDGIWEHFMGVRNYFGGISVPDTQLGDAFRMWEYARKKCVRRFLASQVLEQKKRCVTLAAFHPPLPPQAPTTQPTTLRWAALCKNLCF